MTAIATEQNITYNVNQVFSIFSNFIFYFCCCCCCCWTRIALFLSKYFNRMICGKKLDHSKTFASPLSELDRADLVDFLLPDALESSSKSGESGSEVGKGEFCWLFVISSILLNNSAFNALLFGIWKRKTRTLAIINKRIVTWSYWFLLN